MKKCVEENLNRYEKALNSNPERADNTFIFPFTDENYEFRVEVDRITIEKYFTEYSKRPKLALNMLIDICTICKDALNPLYELLEDLK